MRKKTKDMKAYQRNYRLKCLEQDKLKKIKKCLYCGNFISRYKKFCNAGHSIKYRYENNLIDKKEITKKARIVHKEKVKQNFGTDKQKKHIDYSGYIVICIPNKHIREHIYVFEREYGKIPKGFVVHHKNFNKQDNRIENLQLMSSKEHKVLHSKINYPKGSFFGINKFQSEFKCVK